MFQRIFLGIIFATFIVPAYAQEVVVQQPTTWSELANAALAALAAVLVAAVPLIGLTLRNLIAQRSKVAAAAYDNFIRERLEAGAIAFLRAEEERLKQLLAHPGTASSSPAPSTIAGRQQIVAAAQPKFEAAFKESLEHFGKRGDQVKDFLLGRVETALAKPETVVAYPLQK